MVVCQAIYRIVRLYTDPLPNRPLSHRSGSNSYTVAGQRRWYWVNLDSLPATMNKETACNQVRRWHEHPVLVMYVSPLNMSRLLKPTCRNEYARKKYVPAVRLNPQTYVGLKNYFGTNLAVLSPTRMWSE